MRRRRPLAALLALEGPQADLPGVGVEARHVDVVPNEDKAADELAYLHRGDDRLAADLVARGGEAVVRVHDRVDERVEEPGEGAGGRFSARPADIAVVASGGRVGRVVWRRAGRRQAHEDPHALVLQPNAQVHVPRRAKVVEALQEGDLRRRWRRNEAEGGLRATSYRGGRGTLRGDAFFPLRTSHAVSRYSTYFE